MITRYLKDVATLASIIFVLMVVGMAILLWVTEEPLRHSLGDTAQWFGGLALFMGAYIPLTRAWINRTRRER